jgi:hypothetical protein
MSSGKSGHPGEGTPYKWKAPQGVWCQRNSPETNHGFYRDEFIPEAYSDGDHRTRRVDGYGSCKSLAPLAAYANVEACWFFAVAD